MLENKFYKISSQELLGESSYRFRISLVEDCDVYHGHFPEKPVSPGVCNMQMIKECAEKVVDKPLVLTNLQQVRLLKLITPKDYSTLDLNIDVIVTEEQIYKVKAQIAHDEIVCLDYKAELKLA